MNEQVYPEHEMVYYEDVDGSLGGSNPSLAMMPDVWSNATSFPPLNSVAFTTTGNELSLFFDATPLPENFYKQGWLGNVKAVC